MKIEKFTMEQVLEKVTLAQEVYDKKFESVIKKKYINMMKCTMDYHFIIVVMLIGMICLKMDLY